MSETGKRMKFTVPLVPPSVNHYVKHTRKGRHYVTAEARAFKEAVAIFARGNSVAAETYAVGIGIFLGKRMRGDLDNFLKVTLDALVSARVIHSDAAITSLSISKARDAQNPRTEIEVTAVVGELSGGLGESEF
jgi:Holliday junction resolvase RusA-like endonuclease